MTPFRSTIGRVTAAFLLVLGLSVQAAPAHAEPVTESVPTMIILDASGSMLNDDAPGLRIDAAKQAIHGLVDRLPSDAQLGLEVYGTGTGNSDAEKEAGCKDVTTLVPVGPVDKAGFLGAVDGVTASGFTPIGPALRKAAEELPARGPRAVVLVSDGIDTCSPPPPCEVAEELSSGGLDLTVHAVGFLVDDEARADLQCIAEATGGTYADANNADQLDQALQHKVEQAITGYQIEGVPVTGSDSADDPATPLLTPGQYIDAMPALPDSSSEIRRYYKIDPPEGWTPRVSIVAVPSAKPDSDDAVALNLDAEDSQGMNCGFDGETTTGHFATEPLVISTVVFCDGTRLLTLTRSGALDWDKELPLELVVRFEPPADASGVPPQEERPIPDPPARSAQVFSTTGGSTFNNAAEITPGQTYSSTVQDGQMLYFKVPVTWGQQIAYKFEAGAREGNPESMVQTQVKIYDPMRDDHFTRETQDWYGEGANVSLPVTGGTDEPVRYTSLDYSLDGYYYVVLYFTDNLPGDEIRQNFEFTVDTPGEIEPGPIYLTDGSTPVPPSSTSAPAPDPGPGPVEPAPTRSNAITWWLVGALAVAGAAAGAGGLIVRRRRG